MDPGGRILLNYNVNQFKHSITNVNVHCNFTLWLTEEPFHNFVHVSFCLSVVWQSRKTYLIEVQDNRRESAPSLLSLLSASLHLFSLYLSLSVSYIVKVTSPLHSLSHYLRPLSAFNRTPPGTIHSFRCCKNAHCLSHTITASHCSK